MPDYAVVKEIFKTFVTEEPDYDTGDIVYSVLNLHGVWGRMYLFFERESGEFRYCSTHL